jgi:hypothetical protein
MHHAMSERVGARGKTISGAGLLILGALFLGAYATEKDSGHQQRPYRQ